MSAARSGPFGPRRALVKRSPSGSAAHCAASAESTASGPSSRKRVTPSASSSPTPAAKRTAPRAWRTQ